MLTMISERIVAARASRLAIETDGWRTKHPEREEHHDDVDDPEDDRRGEDPRRVGARSRSRIATERMIPTAMPISDDGDPDSPAGEHAETTIAPTRRFATRRG